MERAARIAAAYADVLRRRAVLAGGSVIELDGISMAFTELPDPSVNPGIVTRLPQDPAGTISHAAHLAEARGFALGLELERGRFPEVEAALREAGLAPSFARSALAIASHDLRAADPDGSRVGPVLDTSDLGDALRVDMDVFGTERSVSEGLLPAALLEAPDVRAVVGKREGEAVGSAIGYLSERTVGVFGVAVAEGCRRRGIGSAMTAAAAHAMDGHDLVWLHPTDLAGPMYERLGFTPVAVWEVWESAR